MVEDNPGMFRAGGMASEKTSIAGYEDASGSACKGQLRIIVSCTHACIDCGRHVNTASTQPMGNPGVDLLVQVKT